MKYIILTILLLIMANKQAKALDISLVQGFAYHYNESPDYNDSVFKDSLTSTNTLLNITHKSYAFTVLADSQGDLSTALSYSHNLLYRPKYTLNSIIGIYNLRSEKKLEDAIVSMFPSFNIGHRTYSITPLVGLEFQYKINDRISLDILATPAFTLFGLKLSL